MKRMKHLYILCSLVLLLVSCTPATPESGESNNIIPANGIGTQKETIEPIVENKILSENFTMDEAIKAGYEIVSDLINVTDNSYVNNFWNEVKQNNPSSYKKLYYEKGILTYYFELIFADGIFTKNMYVLSENGYMIDGELVKDKKTVTYDRVVAVKRFNEKTDYNKQTAEGKNNDCIVEVYLVNGDIRWKELNALYYQSAFSSVGNNKANKNLYDVHSYTRKEVTDEDIKLINGDKEEISKYTDVYSYNGYLCAETVFIPGKE
ncbi:MAG: hypothetical protein E7665_06265 [Ruminococcaceae bacterium]|nr:hypothetical protein [Oscillospiraceae bacterium]